MSNHSHHRSSSASSSTIAPGSTPSSQSHDPLHRALGLNHQSTTVKNTTDTTTIPTSTSSTPASLPHDIFSITDEELAAQYTFENEIGFGNWGSIWRISTNSSSHHGSPKTLAIKLVHRDKSSNTTSARVKSLWGEFKTLRRFKTNPCPHLLRISSFIITPSYALLTMAFHPGLLPVRLGESDRKTARYLRGLLAGTEFLHRHHVTHNDIKPANVVISADDEPVLIDFGFAVSYGSDWDGAEKGEKRYWSYLSWGTPEYLSPQRAKGEAHDERLSDIWSLGITMYEVVVGRTPFEQNETEEFLTKEALEVYYQRTLTGAFLGTYQLSGPLHELLQSMITPDPYSRLPSCAQALLHPFFDHLIRPAPPTRRPVVGASVKDRLRAFEPVSVSDSATRPPPIPRPLTSVINKRIQQLAPVPDPVVKPLAAADPEPVTKLIVEPITEPTVQPSSEPTPNPETHLLIEPCLEPTLQSSPVSTKEIHGPRLEPAIEISPAVIETPPHELASGVALKPRARLSGSVPKLRSRPSEPIVKSRDSVSRTRLVSTKARPISAIRVFRDPTEAASLRSSAAVTSRLAGTILADQCQNTPPRTFKRVPTNTVAKPKPTIYDEENTGEPVDLTPPVKGVLSSPFKSTTALRSARRTSRTAQVAVVTPPSRSKINASPRMTSVERVRTRLVSTVDVDGSALAVPRRVVNTSDSMRRARVRCVSGPGIPQGELAPPKPLSRERVNSSASTLKPPRKALGSPFRPTTVIKSPSTATAPLSMRSSSHGAISKLKARTPESAPSTPLKSKPPSTVRSRTCVIGPMVIN